MPTSKSNVILALYPHANGFGYAYMENPRKLLEYGTVRINPICNRSVMNRIRNSMDFLRPSIVLVQDPEAKSSRTGRRVKRLIRKIVLYAQELNLPVHQYSRDQIRQVFSQFQAKTKYEISQIIIGEFKELEMKSPKPRKLWMSEHHNMPIFDALSLSLTHYYLQD